MGCDFFTVVRIPAGTPRDRALEVDVEIEGDRLDCVAYLIPTGWHALAGFAINYGIEQLYPHRRGEWVTGDGLYREVRLNWRMPERRLRLTVKAYNEDSVYEHKLFIWFTTSDVEEDRLGWLVETLARIARWIGL